MSDVKKYRKKPVVIDAWQLTYENQYEIAKWIDDTWTEESNVSAPMLIKIGGGLIIPTLEGDMHADLGDFIIKGVNGEFYPCKAEIFAKTYEAAE